MVEHDEDYDQMMQAEKKWGTFKVANNYRGVYVETCDSCKHVDHGYEGELDCGHPDRYNDELGGWTVTSVDHLDVCDKYEVSHE